MREGGKEVNTHLFPEMVGGANEVNYVKMLWKTSNVIKKIILWESSLFEVFIFNQEIA